MSKDRINTVVTITLIPQQVQAIEERGDELQAFCEVAVQERIESTETPRARAQADLAPQLAEEVQFLRGMVNALCEQRDRALADHAKAVAALNVEKHRALRDSAGRVRADDQGHGAAAGAHPG